jgi:hypothetical protein
MIDKDARKQLAEIIGQPLVDALTAVEDAIPLAADHSGARPEREVHLAEVNRVQAQRDRAEHLLDVLVTALVAGQVDGALELAKTLDHARKCPTCKKAGL